MQNLTNNINKSSLTSVSKTNFGTQLMLLLLHAGLVQKYFLLGGGGVGAYSRVALINFFGFQGGCLFKGGWLIK